MQAWQSFWRDAIRSQAQVPKYEIDPTWPKPLPGLMVTGRAGGICVDAQDHIFEVNRGDLQDKEKLVGTPAPPVLEYDSDGNLVNTFGDFKTAPASIHGCIVDKDNNIYVAGNDDAVVQKYTHDGSKMLLQIGTKGLFDSSTGLITGIAMNRSKTLLNKPADIAVDPDERRHLHCRRLRRSSHRGVRQGRKIPAPVWRAGHEG